MKRRSFIGLLAATPAGLLGVVKAAPEVVKPSVWQVVVIWTNGSEACYTPFPHAVEAKARHCFDYFSRMEYNVDAVVLRKDGQAVEALQL